ncbi:DUF3794 domain-containing protein [Inediibacterium massiliense]|uniref:DUF3794 domain-containing protein n=1 Tax=Inediibacterium massiliense TaxID=1658111 RepID=UPI0006B5F688|nr:DUF3794 domain-containing protein [Inediibacterium massiliense]
MYTIKECEKIKNYSNIADYCYITTMGKSSCGKVELKEEELCCGSLYIKLPPKYGKVCIDELGFWKYTPNDNYKGFDYFEVLYCSTQKQKKIFKILISVAPKKEAFKQISIQEYVKIPDIKPDIEEIIDVCVDVNIVHTNIVKTSKGRSYEGQILTGYKLLVVGFLEQHIEYIADQPNQSVHGAHFNIPFGTYIILPKNYCKLFPVVVHPIVEDIFYQKIDKRNIFKNITLLVEGRTC